MRGKWWGSWGVLGPFRRADCGWKPSPGQICNTGDSTGPCSTCLEAAVGKLWCSVGSTIQAWVSTSVMLTQWWNCPSCSFLSQQPHHYCSFSCNSGCVEHWLTWFLKLSQRTSVGRCASTAHDCSSNYEPEAGMLLFLISLRFLILLLGITSQTNYLHLNPSQSWLPSTLSWSEAKKSSELTKIFEILFMKTNLETDTLWGP